MSEISYYDIVAHYESCLQEHGVGARAVNWKSEEDAARRYDVMLGLLPESSKPGTLLDFGCGLGDLRPHLQRRGLTRIVYEGLEVSPDFAAAAQARNPDARILCMDVLRDPAALGFYDYIVMNGIFTRRQTLSLADMHAYMRRLLSVLFEKCRVGLAFNVMSKAVDWEDEALFHPEPAAVIDVICRDLSRHYVLRNDYGLHETTFYIYRRPNFRAPSD